MAIYVPALPTFSSFDRFRELLENQIRIAYSCLSDFENCEIIPPETRNEYISRYINLFSCFSESRYQIEESVTKLTARRNNISLLETMQEKEFEYYCCELLEASKASIQCAEDILSALRSMDSIERHWAAHHWPGGTIDNPKYEEFFFLAVSMRACFTCCMHEVNEFKDYYHNMKELCLGID